MKVIIAISLLLLSTSFIPSIKDDTSKTLTIKLEGIKNDKGMIEVGVYNNKENFPIKGKTYKLKRVKAEKNTMSIDIPYLKKGYYAVAIFHDEDNSKDINKNWLGIPTEGYCFSKNFVPKFSAPEFSDCAVYISDNKEISVKMIY